VLTLLGQETENLAHDIASPSGLEGLLLQSLPIFATTVDEEGPKIRTKSDQNSEESRIVSSHYLHTLLQIRLPNNYNYLPNLGDLEAAQTKQGITTRFP
jgi:hypothetical protein